MGHDVIADCTWCHRPQALLHDPHLWLEVGEGEGFLLEDGSRALKPMREYACSILGGSSTERIPVTKEIFLPGTFFIFIFIFISICVLCRWHKSEHLPFCCCRVQARSEVLVPSVTLEAFLACIVRGTTVCTLVVLNLFCCIFDGRVEGTDKRVHPRLPRLVS